MGLGGSPKRYGLPLQLLTGACQRECGQSDEFFLILKQS